jgi:hypothetical protein
VVDLCGVKRNLDRHHFVRKALTSIVSIMPCNTNMNHRSLSNRNTMLTGHTREGAVPSPRRRNHLWNNCMHSEPSSWPPVPRRLGPFETADLFREQGASGALTSPRVLSYTYIVPPPMGGWLHRVPRNAADVCRSPRVLSHPHWP